jgi:hypothetical protein
MERKHQERRFEIAGLTKSAVANRSSLKFTSAARVIMCGVDDEAQIQALMLDVDRSLLRENLKLTPAQRLEKFVSVIHLASELREAGIRSRVEARATNASAR